MCHFYEKKKTLSALQRELRKNWPHTWVGSHDYLWGEMGTNCTWNKFKNSSEGCDIQFDHERIGNLSCNAHINRYYGLLSAAFEKLRQHLPIESKIDIIQMTVQYVNNNIGFTGLCFTFCVFGATPPPARSVPAPDELAQAQAIDAAMEARVRDFARWKLYIAHKYRKAFVSKQQHLDKLRFRAPVSTYKDI